MLRPPITRALLVARDRTAADARVVEAEFPSLRVEVTARHDGAVVIDGGAWRALDDFAPFDRAVEGSASGALAVADDGARVAETAREVLTRYQRHVGRRNAASDAALFDGVLSAHAALHDRAKPLVAADHDHALDVWQWALRLDPGASLAAQLAALFHDVERLVSEADRRVEHHAPDYQAFKDAHAGVGAVMAFATLREAGVDLASALRARELIAVHERRGGDPEVALLNDADGLSFFALNSPGYLNYFGPEQTRRKVAWTLGRLSPSARRRLDRVRLLPAVRVMVEECPAARAVHDGATPGGGA